MAAGVNQAAIAAALKTVYSPKRKKTLVATSRPFLADMKPDTSMGAGPFVVNMRHTGLGTDSATFSESSSLAASNALGYANWTMNAIKYYATAEIENIVIRGSQKDPQAFVKLLTDHIDGAYESWSNAMAHYSLGNGYGSLGSLNVTPGANAYFDVKSREEALRFVKGHRVFFAANDTAAARNAGASVTVTGKQGTRVFTAEASVIGTVAAAVAGDKIYRIGNHNIAGGTTRTMPTGFQAFCPLTGVGSTSLHGTDTTTSDTLVGQRVPALSFSIGDCFIDLGMKIVGAGGIPVRGYLGVTQFANLAKELGNDRRYVEHTSRVGIGFDAITLSLPGVGAVPIICDRNISPDMGLLCSDDWYMGSIGEAPSILTDGKTIWRDTDDSVQIRVGGYVNFFTTAPCWSGILDFTSAT